MHRSYLIKLHEPFYQSHEELEKNYKAVYFPLLKLLKSRNGYSGTLCMSLSFLDVMEKGGYQDWIKEIKEMVDKQKIDMCNTFAYNPIKELNKKDILEELIFLNEYALSHYFGKIQTIEGEEAFVIKDLTGFESGGLETNEVLKEILKDFSYNWSLLGTNDNYLTDYKFYNLEAKETKFIDVIIAENTNELINNNNSLLVLDLSSNKNVISSHTAHYELLSTIYSSDREIQHISNNTDSVILYQYNNTADEERHRDDIKNEATNNIQEKNETRDNSQEYIKELKNILINVLRQQKVNEREYNVNEVILGNKISEKTHSRISLFKLLSQDLEDLYIQRETIQEKNEYEQKRNKVKREIQSVINKIQGKEKEELSELIDLI